MLKIKQKRSIFHRLRNWNSKKLNNFAKIRQMTWNTCILDLLDSVIYLFIHLFVHFLASLSCQVFVTHWQWEASRVPSLRELATYIRATIQTNNTEINVQLQAPCVCYKNIPRVTSPVVETANCLCRKEQGWNHPLHFTVRPFTLAVVQHLLRWDKHFCKINFRMMILSELYLTGWGIN